MQAERQVPGEPDIGCEGRTDNDLALRTNVEQARPEGQGNAKAGADERGCHGHGFQKWLEALPRVKD
ncbi:hypothetical protein D3C86_2206030 [compost metagenome]